MKGKKIGFALCGSFCTFSHAISQIKALTEAGAEVFPILSENAAGTDTRFGKAEDICRRIREITGNEIIKTISDAEPIGPQNKLDLMIIAPCTGNTLAKMANGITDTSVTMAAKAHIRNNKPVLICLATNDGLSASAQNIGKMLRVKNIYFVPLRQDDPKAKPASIVSDFTGIIPAAEFAMKGEQIQPILEGQLAVGN